jgi:hypothetical protein
MIDAIRALHSQSEIRDADPDHLRNGDITSIMKAALLSESKPVRSHQYELLVRFSYF